MYMAATKINHLKKALFSFISKEEIRKIAAETGFVKRVRSLDAVMFFWAVLLSVGSGTKRSFTEIKRVYEMRTDCKPMSRSAFYERFNGKFADFMKIILGKICGRMSEPLKPLENLLKMFIDVILIDSTFLRVDDRLEVPYQSIGRNRGKGKMKAEVKVQVTMSATANAPKLIRLSAGKEHEKHGVRIGEWVKGMLILADRGFFSLKYFFDIHRHGGFFISRLTWSFNPYIVGDNTLGIPFPVLYFGSRLKEIVSNMERIRKTDVMDLEVALGNRRPTSEIMLGFMRIVCVWNAKNNRFNCYLTNIPTDMMKAEDVARSYAVRWEIEMVFKELKSYYRLDQFCTKKQECVESLIYAAFLTFILSRHILNTIREGHGLTAAESPERLFGKAFIVICPNLLHDMFHPHACNRDWNEHEKFLLKWMKPPKNKRSHNLSVARN